MTRTILYKTIYIIPFLFLTNCSREPDPAEIRYQEIAMAENASEELTEFQYQLDTYTNDHGALSTAMQEEWDQAKTDYLNAAESLKAASATELDEALRTFNDAWEKLLATYQSARSSLK